MFNYKKGNSDIAFFVGMIVVLALLWWASGGAQKKEGEQGSLFSVPQFGSPVISGGNSSSGSTEPGRDGNGKAVSAFKDQVRISSLGSASNAYDPDAEYIVLEADGNNKESVNITGWGLVNGRGSNVVASGIAQKKGVADQVNIPDGRLVYLPGSATPLQPIKLAPGEKAVVVSGYVPDFGGYSGSFRSNICLGYLEDEDDKFTPQLENQCPDPEIEPGIEFIDDECREFVADMQRCHTPRFRSYTEEGDRRRNTPSVDNISGFSSSCRSYLREHYSYGGCVKNHMYDKDFYGSEWRVYLNRPWEMWAKGEETISLFDDRGLLVDQKSY